MNFLKMLQLALSLLPIIHDAVDQVEQLFPQGGYGAQKLEMVKGLIEKTLAVSDATGATMSTLWPIVAEIVSKVVALKKSVTAPASAS